MSCNACNEGYNLLSGEDWYVFIDKKRHRLVCRSGGNEHDYKEIELCPMCGESLTPPEPLTLEQLEERTTPVWVKLDPPYINDCKGYWCLCNKGFITPPSCMPFNAKDRPNWIFYDRESKDETPV